MGLADGLAVGIGMFMSIFCCGFWEADGICMPGMFIWLCGEAEGDACGICIPGIFICICGDAEGVACGIRIPGMFCICSGEGCGVADCLDGDEGFAGMFIPGMLPI